MDLVFQVETILTLAVLNVTVWKTLNQIDRWFECRRRARGENHETD